MSVVAREAALAAPVARKRWPAPRFSASGVAASVVLALALAVLLVGWLGGVEGFRRFHSGFAATVPTTALCLVALALGILVLPRGSGVLLARLLAATAAGVTVASFAIRQTTLAKGIDGFLAPSVVGSEGTAFATTVLTLAGSLCLWGRTLPPGQVPQRAMEVIATAALLLAGTASVGYVYDVAALYRVFVFTSMALPTALAFSVLFLALLLARPEDNWTRSFAGVGAGSATARRMLPILAIGPLCFLTLELSAKGYFLPNFGYSVITIVLIAISTVAICINAAIENRAEARAQALLSDLVRSNQERGLLLAELHHRVKNNVQQISALITLEARGVEDPALRGKLDALSARVRAIGMIHELLMHSPSVVDIDLKDVLHRLNAFMATANGLEARRIALRDDCAALVVPLDTAVTAGLLVVELVMNSIKHAFPDAASGAITVTVALDGDRVRLTVSDDGVGLARNAGPPGLGTKITAGLVRKLRGTLTTASGRGTCTTVEFPLPEERIDG